MVARTMTSTVDTSTWHPVARSAELLPGDNIVAGFACGQELALWRAADGTAQAWENRCPHRSVRFTLGQVVGGDRLACAYHGWQYAAGSGQCVRIPAHPSMAVPPSVCAKTFHAAEAAGMLWVNLADAARSGVPPAGAVPAGWSFCRTLGLRTAVDEAHRALAAHGFTAEGPVAFRGRLGGANTAALVLDAQPQLAFVHLWTDAAPGSEAMRNLHIAARQLRSSIEEALQPAQPA
jgi:phenylpropionate dioxygenase-like ring-hydroxylating dioxygenase large terminal subunit